MPRRLMMGALLVAAFASTAPGVPRDARCTAAKLRLAERKARGLVKCQSHALVTGTSVKSSCIAAVEVKFAAAWARVEAAGGCATTGDADSIEAMVEDFVAQLLAALQSTTTTTTTSASTSSSCPPATALYCGVSGCAPLQARCPSGMACTTIEEGCSCVGPAIPCGDARLTGLSRDLCRWGTCPAGTTCGAVPKQGECGFDCACQ